MLTRKQSALLGQQPRRLLKPYHVVGVRALRNIPVRTAVAAVEAEPAAASPPPFQPVGEDEEKAFPFPLPMDSVQQKLAGIPTPMFYPVLTAAVGLSAMLGFFGVKAIPVEHEAKAVASVGVAAALGAATVAAVLEAKKRRDSCAIVELYNRIVDLPDPSHLPGDVVSDVGSKYGVSMQKEQLEGMQRVYAQYLESLIPTEDKQLRGDEGAKVAAFMNALGLTEEEVATVHLDLGRKLFRDGVETRDRQVKWEQKKAFQRLVYVSALAFGDQKMAMLLPWKEQFNLNDAQMFVARRDNAKTIFKAHLDREGGIIPADSTFLRGLREYQAKVKMMDESAVELVREYSRKHVEDSLQKCLELMKSVGSSRNVPALCAEVQSVINYARGLAAAAIEDDIIPGVCVPTIQGGHLLHPETTKARELREVFKAFLRAQLDEMGEFTKELDDDMVLFQTVLCIAPKEAQLLRDETSARLYKKLLRDEVVSKRIDSAADPSTVLHAICEKVRFSPEAATELHKQLYKQKLGSLLESKKELSDSDDEDLARIRRVLCLSPHVVTRAMRETCGKELEEVFSDIFLMGAKPVPNQDLERMDRIVKGLRIEPDVALDILKQMTLEKFRSIVKTAQKQAWNRKVAALTMKKLVQFNSITITPLLEHVKGYKASGDASSAAASASSTSSTRKAGEYFEEERAGQSEINLRGEIEPETCAVMYKQYLMYSVAGEVVELPAGGMMRKKNSGTTRHAESMRLSQLGEILGMTPEEMAAAQTDLAEEAFKEQVLEVTRTGPLTEERGEYLDEMRIKMGISKEAGAKVQKAVRAELAGASAEEEDGSGARWTLERAIALHKGGGSVETVMEEITRRNLYRREITKLVADGTGDLDSEYVLTYLPQVLELEKRKVDMAVKELVGSRRRMLLVQSVSQLRQKKGSDAVTSLNNLISCCKALPEKTPMPWTEQQELKDLYQAYCEKEANGDKRSVLQHAFGLSDQEVKELSALSQSEEVPRVAINKDDEGFF